MLNIQKCIWQKDILLIYAGNYIITVLLLSSNISKIYPIVSNL